MFEKAYQFVKGYEATGLVNREFDLALSTGLGVTVGVVCTILFVAFWIRKNREEASQNKRAAQRVYPTAY